MISETEIPGSLDVMVLPGVTLFPGTFLPLYIFEPRYRKMLARALDSHRMFAVGQPTSAEDDASLFSVGGAGFVRACVANPDGTSHLILQGVARVVFSEWTTIEACRHARVAVLDSRTTTPVTARALRGEVFALCEQLTAKNEDFGRMLETLAEHGNDPEQFSDLVASMAIGDAAIRQRLLEELDVTGRLEILAAYLTRLAENA